MPQLRKDPIVNRWVIIATERARRPAAFIEPVNNQTDPSQCPFCKDQAGQEILRHESVRIVKSGNPYFNNDKPYEVHNHGLYQSCTSYGSHEVVIECAEHTANMADLSVGQIKSVFSAYAVRMHHLHQDNHVQYVLAYKNYGVAAGSRSIGHSRSQIMAVPIVPARVKDKLNGAKLYFDFHERSLFLDLVRQEQKNQERVILESDNFIAFCPFAVRFPFEVWIVPKPKIQHCHFDVGVRGYEEELAGVMRRVLLKFKIGLNDPAYNYVIQSAPFDFKAHDSYSWHIEVLPRLTRVAGFERGTGFYINPLPPEMTAKFLREVDV